MSSHEHNYILTGTDTYDAVDRGRTWHYTVKHYECINPGCPRPNKDEVTRN